jgi:hypothetical protein
MMAEISADRGIKSRQRAALRRRVHQIYLSFNRGLWDKCVALVDPLLKEHSKVKPSVYVEQQQAFKHTYGRIDPWHIRISLHLDASSNKHDPRPFAYVYILWQDAGHGFHMFRERWVQHGGRWFTRVAGLLPNGRPTA